VKRIEGLRQVEEVKKDSRLHKVRGDRRTNIRAHEVEAIRKERIEQKTCRATWLSHSSVLSRVVGVSGKEFDAASKEHV